MGLCGHSKVRHVEEVGDDQQMRRVALNVLNKHSQAADKGCWNMVGVSHHHVKTSTFLDVRSDLRLGRIPWNVLQ